ncbi:MAG: hypothetical protein R2706_21155 [Acidimicrobiales bacterium]
MAARVMTRSGAATAPTNWPAAAANDRLIGDDGDDGLYGNQRRHDLRRERSSVLVGDGLAATSWLATTLTPAPVNPCPLV